MTDAAGNVRGIRLRRPNGFKFSVTGGRKGLFIPSGVESGDSLLLVCEGPTDATALLDMGLVNVVGRPSCTGGIKLIVEMVRRRRPLEVVVVADGDEPGRRGADNLASVLVAYAPAVRVIAPPAGIKDARAWLQAGGTRRDVQEATGAALVRRLVIRTRVINGTKG
jgi:DNA primase